MFWSERLVEAWIEHQFTWSDDLHQTWNYESGCVLRAVEAVWRRTGKALYFERIRAILDSLVDMNGLIRTYVLEDYNLDQIQEGKLLFTLYEQTREERYRRAIERLLCQLRGQPRTETGGFWHKKIYPYQMWLDGVYMTAPFLAQYAQTFQQPAWFDVAVEHALTMERQTRDRVTGLLYHGWDESREQRWADPKTGCSSVFWGRAMGWYAMAIVDILDFLPVDHSRRGQLVGIFHRLMRAVVAVQDGVSGLWYQVLDQSERQGNYLESSCSAMFVYALAKGVRLHYLQDSFLPAAERAYHGLLTHALHVDEAGRPQLEFCNAVAGLGGDPYRDGSFDYYVHERIVVNDPKAIAAFILASVEMERWDMDGAEDRRDGYANVCHMRGQ